MAIVKSISNSIKNSSAISKALDYITDSKKTSLVSFENCGGDTSDIASDFENLRISFNQNKGILAHHFVQSFSPEDNITPEQAHAIALEFIKKVAPDFQVVVTTHVDTEKIHNHFIINSCNMVTGRKLLDNKTTLAEFRHESDLLCVKYGLSVIEKSGGRSIDQATYQLSMKGKSWKSQLVNDLDAARVSCKGKLDFIDFMNKRGYAIRYTDNHITFRKHGESKGIRADTLARQFGEKYTKTNLEKFLGIESVQKHYLHYDKDVGILSMKSKKPKTPPPIPAKVETELQRNSRINAELKALSARNNDKLCYKVVSPEQLESVKLTDAKFAHFAIQQQEGKFNIVYLESESAKINDAVYSLPENVSKR